MASHISRRTDFLRPLYHLVPVRFLFRLFCCVLAPSKSILSTKGIYGAIVEVEREPPPKL